MQFDESGRSLASEMRGETDDRVSRRALSEASENACAGADGNCEVLRNEGCFSGKTIPRPTS
jgi:hypothetical protein